MAETEPVEFRTFGDPVPKGSTHAFKHKTTGRIITRQNSADRLYAYQNLIALAASRARVTRTDKLVKIKILFGIKRPKLHYGTGKNASILKESAPRNHLQPPDLDKLVRAVLDGLTGVAYDDDSQVIGLAASKAWSAKGVTVVTIFYQ